MFRFRRLIRTILAKSKTIYLLNRPTCYLCTFFWCCLGNTPRIFSVFLNPNIYKCDGFYYLSTIVFMYWVKLEICCHLHLTSQIGNNTTTVDSKTSSWRHQDFVPLPNLKDQFKLVYLTGQVPIRLTLFSQQTFQSCCCSPLEQIPLTREYRSGFTGLLTF